MQSQPSPTKTRKAAWYISAVAAAAVVLATVSLTISFKAKRLAAKETKSQESASVTKTRLNLNWIITGSYAGEGLAASRFARENGLEIQIEPGGQGRDPIRLTRDNEFGMAAADEILSAASKGASLVIIGVVNPDSPAAFVALKSSGIKEPKDFIGKRIGILPYGSTGLVYRALLKQVGIDRKSITEVVVSPDLRPFLLANTHDVQPVFVYDETVTLDRDGVVYNLIEPRHYGVRFVGVSYFTTRDTFDKNRKLVGRFLRAVLQGWSYCRQHPEEGIASLRALSPGLDESRELEVLKRGLPYYFRQDGRFLASDPAEWSPMIANLKDFGVIPQQFSASDVLRLEMARQIASEK